MEVVYKINFEKSFLSKLFTAESQLSALLNCWHSAHSSVMHFIPLTSYSIFPKFNHSCKIININTHPHFMIFVRRAKWISKYCSKSALVSHLVHFTPFSFATHHRLTPFPFYDFCKHFPIQKLPVVILQNF